jgi:hypothetical protein
LLLLLLVSLSLSLFARLDNIDLAALHCRYIRSYARVLFVPHGRVLHFLPRNPQECATPASTCKAIFRFEKYCFMCFPATEALNMYSTFPAQGHTLYHFMFYGANRCIAHAKMNSNRQRGS